MDSQKSMFDEVTRLENAFNIIKPHLTPDEHQELKDKILRNYKLYKMGTFGTDINRIVDDVITND